MRASGRLGHSRSLCLKDRHIIRRLNKLLYVFERLTDVLLTRISFLNMHLYL